MAATTEAKLRNAGAGHVDPELFEEAVKELFVLRFPCWTVDKLLINPEHCLEYCEDVRRRICAKPLPSELILGTLLNLRKRGDLTPPAEAGGLFE